MTAWATQAVSGYASLPLIISYADVVELVDTHALGACASRREGSSPFIRTRILFLREISSVG